MKISSEKISANGRLDLGLLALVGAVDFDDDPPNIECEELVEEPPIELGAGGGSIWLMLPIDGGNWGKEGAVDVGDIHREGGIPGAIRSDI